MRPGLQRLLRKNRHVCDSQCHRDALRRENCLAREPGGLDRMSGVWRHGRERKKNLSALPRRWVADGKALAFESKKQVQRYCCFSQLASGLKLVIFTASSAVFRPRFFS